MLIVSRKLGEKIRLGPDTIMEVLKIGGSRVVLGFSGPLPVVREELDDRETDTRVGKEKGKDERIHEKSKKSVERITNPK